MKKKNEMLTTFVRKESQEILSPRPDDFGASLAKLAALAVMDAMAVYYYGFRAAAVVLFCVTLCWGADTLCLILRRKPLHIHDLSAVTTGLAIAAMLPASVHFKAAAAACIFAICIAKHPLGGKDFEIFSCAAAGYIFAELNYPQYVLTYPRPFQQLPLTGISSDMLTTSFSRAAVTGTSVNSGYELLIGKFCGPMGASVTIMIIVCGAVLIGMKTVSPAVLLSQIIAVITGLCVFGKAPIINVLAGGMFLFTAVFLTSDMSQAPKKLMSRIIYGLICGIVTVAAVKIGQAENPAVYASILTAPAARLADRMNISYKRRQRVQTIFGAESTEENGSKGEAAPNE